MGMDAAGPPQHYAARDLWRLPDIREVHIRRRRFDPPRRVTMAGIDREVQDAIEIEIRVSEPFVVRSLGPVLWVGDEPLTIADAKGKDSYGFLSFNPNALKAKASISLSWNSPGAVRKKTTFRYAPPAK